MLLIEAWNTDSAKTFQAQNVMIYGDKQGVNQSFLERCRFRGIGKNQNWVKTKSNPNTNGIQEALWVYWLDLGVKLLVGFQGGGQSPGSSGHFKVFNDTYRGKAP